MQFLKVFVISLTNNIQRLKFHMIHHVIGEEKCFMHDLMFLDKDRFNVLQWCLFGNFALYRLLELLFVNLRNAYLGFGKELA